VKAETVSNSCFLNAAIQQALAADDAIASFSSNLFRRGLDADRAPQLKASFQQLNSKAKRLK
jgi:hypothetical protein